MKRIALYLLVSDDFNAKRPECGYPISDIREETLAELTSSLDLLVYNVGSHPTFTWGATESFIDITFVYRVIWNMVTD